MPARAIRTPSIRRRAAYCVRWTRAEDARGRGRGAADQTLAHALGDDPRRLEQLEERLFALRAAARKHGVPVGVAMLPELRETSARARLAAIATGAASRLPGSGDDATQGGAGGIRRWRPAQLAAPIGPPPAARLDAALNRELPPLKLDRARFTTDAYKARARRSEGPHAAREAVRFLIATNPGQPAGPLMRVASGGELSRLMLALKVVIASKATLPTLIFDEVDAGVGRCHRGCRRRAAGAAGARAVQVLVVTHSPQVAARGRFHLRVAKAVRGSRTATRVDALDPPARREEIARMLAGESVTDAARAAADSLLDHAG